jgi:hypothetical protein
VPRRRVGSRLGIAEIRPRFVDAYPSLERREIGDDELRELLVKAGIAPVLGSDDEFHAEQLPGYDMRAERAQKIKWLGTSVADTTSFSIDRFSFGVGRQGSAIAAFLTQFDVYEWGIYSRALTTTPTTGGLRVDLRRFERHDGALWLRGLSVPVRYLIGICSVT